MEAEKSGKSYEEVEEQLKEMFADEGDTEMAENKQKEPNPINTNSTQKTAPQNKVKRKRKVKQKAGVKEKFPNQVVAPKIDKAKAAVIANESTTYKQKGPYVLIKGTKQVVVNCPANEDETEKITKRIQGHNKIRGMCNSTLSSKYDAETTDKTWLCIFCKKGPHRPKGMGDLFGPFLIPHSLDAVTAMKSPKRKLSDASKQKTIEAWTHESCAISAPNVYLIGTKIVGLEIAMLESKNFICTVCNEDGATLGCLSRGCTEKAHFTCARQSTWFVPKDFRNFCGTHNPATVT